MVDVDAAAGDRPGGLQPAGVLQVKVDAVLQVGLNIPLAQDVDDAQRVVPRPLQLADDRAGVEM